MKGIFYFLLFRSVIEIIDDRMLVFDPKLNEDEFFYKGRLQNRRDINKRQKKDHRWIETIF